MKSKKGTGQAETILYLFFAVIFIMVGILSVKAYLLNAELNKDLHLSNLDFGILSARMIASDNCLSVRETVTLNAGEEEYKVNFVEIGRVDKNRIKNSIINKCLKGFDKDTYKINLYELATDGTRTILENSNGYGNVDCENSNRKGEFLIGLKGSTTELGVFEICIT
ncbi:hypothetical protein CL614_08880 [archaeon]|nr:hypothetical protein [archaeon]|tara:strand:- start:1342 stop:1842 length:501 start_codon:yes stop_codon:yes gene_type:complete